MTITKAKAPKKGVKAITIVGHKRTVFGTRLSHRIICDRCKLEDHIALKPGPEKTAFCRSCAVEVLGKYEQGKTISDQRFEFYCRRCFVGFFAQKKLSKKISDILCPDCLRGFEVWRGKIGQGYNASVRQKTILRGATALRIKVDEPISAD